MPFGRLVHDKAPSCCHISSIPHRILTVASLSFPIHVWLHVAWLHPALASVLQVVVEAERAAFGFAHDVADVLEDFLIAVTWLHVAGHSAGGQIPCSLLLHELVLPLLGLRELCGYDHEA